MTNKDKRENNKNNQDGGKPRPSKPSAATQASKALSKPKQGAIEKPDDYSEHVKGTPTQEQLNRESRKRAIATRTEEILANQMQEDAKRPSRAAKSKTEEDSRRKAAFAQARKEVMQEIREGKQKLNTGVDALADIFGQMTTTRPSAPQSFGMHSSGHAIVGYDPKDGWPLGVNPVTGQVERFATREGGKKKRTYKKKAQKGGQGEFENAIAEDSKSQAAPVSGGKKKRVNKKASKKGGVGEQPQPFGLGDRGAVDLAYPGAPVREYPLPAAQVAQQPPAAPVAQQPPAVPVEQQRRWWDIRQPIDLAAPPGLGERNEQPVQGEPFAPQTPPQSPRGGKKKRTNNKKKSQKGGEVEGAVAEDSKSQAAPLSGGKKKRTNKKK